MKKKIVREVERDNGRSILLRVKSGLYKRMRRESDGLDYDSLAEYIIETMVLHMDMLDGKPILK